jgi:hypothetical protein
VSRYDGPAVSVTVEVCRGELDVRIRGLDRFLALSGGVRLPLSAVLSARVRDRVAALADGPKLRLPGSYLPGVVRAGSYGLGDDRELWCVHRAPTVLAIELTGQRYRRVVVEVPDPEQAAKEINQL